MKSLFKAKYLLLFVMGLSLYSCGKNSSGGSGGSGSSTIGINGDGSITAGNSGQNFQTIDELRNAFNAMSLEAGVTEGMYIYHIGNHYTGNSSGGGGTGGGITITGCLFGIFGDCDDNGNGGQQNNYQLQQYLNYGRMLKVRNLDQNANTLNLAKATGVYYNDFTYSNYVLTRTHNDYRSMLGMSSSYNQAKLANATIELQSGERVQAVVVEYIKESYYGVPNSIKRYVLSTNLPIAANPIAVLHGLRAEVTGVLSTVGNNIKLRRIEIDTITELSYYNNQVIERNLNIYIN